MYVRTYLYKLIVITIAIVVVNVGMYVCMYVVLTPKAVLLIVLS